eukprot:CAMPEP_0184322470 /NCGR_PEP_ID=MMETSP1049-20130417/124631_1 /TAXON_ID=77928 /ORGANISM="Proteomonas sulcata, Strain CCMP704" /LENGTH=71 /DNA_ID=CAMNT_0026643617 /DNA_START=1477 /DNA_END=1693 /DNA_ORIENTATION=+
MLQKCLKIPDRQSHKLLQSPRVAECPGPQADPLQSCDFFNLRVSYEVPIVPQKVDEQTEPTQLDLEPPLAP